ncbi:hypothetical protein F5146DRAFT_999109 [Armillaria mellea]|nr:hypothetical protein F5146DRAFT_999109 [Armillaria mellea]
MTLEHIRCIESEKANRCGITSRCGMARTNEQHVDVLSMLLVELPVKGARVVFDPAVDTRPASLLAEYDLVVFTNSRNALLFGFVACSATTRKNPLIELGLSKAKERTYTLLVDWIPTCEGWEERAERTPRPILKEIEECSGGFDVSMTSVGYVYELRRFMSKIRHALQDSMHIFRDSIAKQAIVMNWGSAVSFFPRKSSRSPPYMIKDISKVDAVFVSHSHYDQQPHSSSAIQTAPLITK